MYARLAPKHQAGLQSRYWLVCIWDGIWELSDLGLWAVLAIVCFSGLDVNSPDTSTYPKVDGIEIRRDE